MATNSDQKNRGKIVEIKGVVIDAVFPNELPAIYSGLRITVDDRELRNPSARALSARRPASGSGTPVASTSRTRASRSPCPSAT